MRFLVDEDMPRSTARLLRDAGFDAVDVRDIGLAAHADTEIFQAAQAMQATIVTADLGFANLTVYPLGTHAGIIITRTPNKLPTLHLNNLILRALTSLADDDLLGALVVVEVGRTRVRRAGS